MNRVLFAADCLDVLNDADALADGSIDLIYLDPPFNSNSTYNLPFKGRDRSLKPVEAFEDTWRWGEGDDERLSALERNPQTRHLATIVKFAAEVESGRRRKNSLAAYLLNMAQRLVAMRRVLKETGSIYLHCDPTASHYLKLLMDGIYGRKNFRNEIVWQRTNRGHKGSQFAPRHFNTNTDMLLFYSKSQDHSFYLNRVLLPYEPGYLRQTFRFQDDKGVYARVSPFRRAGAGARPNLCYEYNGYSAPVPTGWALSKEKLKRLDAEGDLEFIDDKVFRKSRPKGKKPSNLWLFDHIGGALGKERLGYPTQKPLALMERIIKASSNIGDTVLDPFCGCGTTLHAAESLERKWIGIDISKFSTGLIRRRIIDNFAYLNRDDIMIHGAPETIAEARDLARADAFEFEKWVCGALDANGMYKRPGAPGADGGVDGVVELPVIRQVGSKYESQPEYVIIQVKGGQVSPNSVKALSETVSRLGAIAGIMVCFRDQLGKVENQRSRALWSDAYKQYPVIQGFSIEGLLADERPNLPPTWGFKHGGRTSAPLL